MTGGVAPEDSTLVLGAKDVYELLSMADCVKVMDETFREWRGVRLVSCHVRSCLSRTIRGWSR